MKDNLKLLSLACAVLLIASCSEEQVKVSENMESIHEDKGIPVKVRTAEHETFTSSQVYNSNLKGVRESSGKAMIADTVEEILFNVGDYVVKGQTVIKFPEDNPSVSYYQAEAAYKAAEKAFVRVENLFKNNGVSRQNYDDARTQYEVQLANWENVQKLVRVTAPISGFITRINVSESDNVNPGAELFTVSNYSELITTVYVNDNQIGEISEGQNVLAQWNGRSITGKVTQVDLAKDPRKKAFAVRIRLNNSELAIPSGVSANLRIDVQYVDDAFVLHRNEIMHSGDESYVLVEIDGYARKMPVITGEMQGMKYRVKSGLKEGDRIITEGLNLVRADDKVRVVEDPAVMAGR